MKEVTLCGGKVCCPKLAVERKGGELIFHIIDDDGTTIVMESQIARNLALAIFEEIGKI